MNLNLTRERLLASTMLCGVALAVVTAGSASAQTATPADAEVSAVVVTGSRVPQPNEASASPVQVVSAQEVTLGGRPATIDVLNQLPQTSINSTVDFGPSSNPLAAPGGSATVDLRGLGPQRTLVLVNGRRLGIGDPNTGNPNPAPDINQIPSQLVDRIEVLTGGASAAYGSDAIAGVVNFVMKHNFEGVQLDAQYGVNSSNPHNDRAQGLLKAAGIPVPDSSWDGKSADYSVIVGANAPDGRGNVTAYATYHVQDPILDASRDFSACQLTTSPVPRCTGSSNSNFFQDASGSGSVYSVLGSNFIVRGTAATNPPAVFNSNPYENLIQQDTRYTGGFFANYELNPSFDLYSELSMMDDRTHTQVAPSGLFQGQGPQPSGGFLINCNNPFLSAQERGAIGCTAANIAAGDTKDLSIGRRNVEGGPRAFEYEHQNFRVVGGSRGKLWGPFSYDVYGSYYYTTVDQSNANFISLANTQNAFLVGGTAANPFCLSHAAGCVPYNIFSDGGVTQNALNYLEETGTSRGTTAERIVEATVTGNLGELGVTSPWAHEGVGVSVGAESRRDHLSFRPDQAELSNDLSGFGGASVPINASQSVQEEYGEAVVPIAQDMPFLKDLRFDGAFRHSKYNTGVKANTYKLAMEWAPINDFRLRASYNRAIRAPNIIELYTPVSVTNTGTVPEDPCAQGATHPATLEQCARTGVTPQQYGNIPQCPSNQCATLTGGNLNLDPEKARTYTYGVLFTPRFLPGFSASVDYYHINLKGEISNIPLDVSFSQCLTTGNPVYCANIVRNPVNGILFGSAVASGGYIVGTNVNVGAGVVSGIDVQANYGLRFEDFGHDGWGRVDVSFDGSYEQHNTTTPLPGAATYDCAGLYGTRCQTITPRWRHTARLTWNSPWDVQLSAAWRYIGSTTLDVDSHEPTIGQGTTDPYNHKLAARSYIDLAGVWNVTEKFAVRAGVNNVFDTNPPVVSSAISGVGGPNSYPTYDLLGRHLFVALTARF